MFEDDSDRDKRKQSLLSFGAPAPEPFGVRSPGSTPAAGGATNEKDPALRHRLARSRHEAGPSPLLAALAAMEGYKAEPVAARAVGQEPVVEPKKSRWSFRDLLSPRLKLEQPEVKTEKPPVERPAHPPELRGAAAPVPPALAEPVVEDEVPRPDLDEPRLDKQGIGEPAIDEFRTGDGDFQAAAGSPDDPRWRPLIDPVSVIGGVGRSKALIVATTLIGALIGVAVALSTPKKYEAFAELLIDPRDLKLTDRDLTQTGLPNDATLAIVENQVRVLSSGTVLNRVVDKLNLTEDSEFNGEKQGGIGNVFSSLRALLSSGSRAGADAGDRRRALAVGNLAESLHVERGGKTFVVSIGATTEEPEKSALIANTLIEVFFKAYGELLSNTAGRATDELQAKLEELRAGLDEAERKVEKYRAEHDLVDAQGKLISDDELVKLNEQLSIARARTSELNARAQSTRSINVQAVLGGGLPEELASPVMSELRSQYAAMKQEADQLSVRLGPRHPQYLAMQAQLSGAREQIANELRRIVASVQTDLKRAVQQEQDLSARLAQLKVRSGDVNVDLVTLRELEREAAAKRAVYEGYLLRAKETGEQRDINTANMSVISQAFPPIDPTGPSRATITLGGMILGFIAGIGLGVLRGIASSLRSAGRARRRSRPAVGMSPAGMSLVQSDSAVPEFRDPGPPAADLATATQEAAMNPLARLMERMRRPASADKADDVPTRPASAEASRPAQYPQMNLLGAEPRANEDPTAMYPYPPQPQAYPQAPYPYAPAPQFQQAQPQSQFQQQPQPAHPPQYAPPQQYAQPPQYPPHFAPPPAARPYPPQPPQPAFHAWQPQPVAYDPYGRPQPVASPYPPYPMPNPPMAAPAPPPAAYSQAPQPAAAEPYPAQAPREMSPIEEVRESLREFRDAICDLTESRARRSY